MSFNNHQSFNTRCNFISSSGEQNLGAGGFVSSVQSSSSQHNGAGGLVSFVQPLSQHNLQLSKQKTEPDLSPQPVSCNTAIPPPTSFGNFNIRQSNSLLCQNGNVRSRFDIGPSPIVSSSSYPTNIQPVPLPINDFNQLQPSFLCPSTIPANTNNLSENRFHQVAQLPSFPNVYQNHLQSIGPTTSSIPINNLNINLQTPPPSISSCHRFSSTSTSSFQNNSSFVVDNNFRTAPPPKHILPPPGNMFAERQQRPPISYQTKVHPSSSVIENKSNSINHNINSANHTMSSGNLTMNSVNHTMNSANHSMNSDNMNGNTTIVPKSSENIRRPSCQFSSSVASSSPNPAALFHNQLYSNSLPLSMNVPPPNFSVPPPNLIIPTLNRSINIRNSLDRSTMTIRNQLDRSTGRGNNVCNDIIVKTEISQPSCSYTSNNLNLNNDNNSISKIVNENINNKSSIESCRKRRRTSRSKSRERSQRSNTRDVERYRRKSRERRRSYERDDNRNRSNCENRRRQQRRSNSRERESKRRRSNSRGSRRNNGRENESRSRRSNSRESRYDQNKSSRNNRSRSKSRLSYYNKNYSKDVSRRKRSYSRSKSISSERTISKSDRLSNEPNNSSNRNELSNSIDKWRLNNCSNEDEMLKEFNLKATMDADTIVELESKIWSRSAPADLYYEMNKTNFNYDSTDRVTEICAQFEELLKTIDDVKKSRPKFDYTSNRLKSKCIHCKKHEMSSDEEDDEEEESGEPVTPQNEISKESGEDNWMKEWELKEKHPFRAHADLWFNDEGEMNDGPLCRCSNKSRRSGIRHNIYQGETRQYCDINSNNSDKLYHYRITFSPPTNFLVNKPTIITFDDHEYIFEGFSLFSHYKLDKLPTCKVIRFNIQYTIVYIEEKLPSSYSIKEIDLFFNYLFYDILELVDLDLHCSFSSEGKNDENQERGCPQFHLMPRFVRELENNGKELIPMYKIIEFFTSSYIPVINEDLVNKKNHLSTYEWQNFVDNIRGMIVIKPGSKPSSIRVDQLDRESENNDSYPDIIHFGIRPPQLSYTGNAQYQKLWKEYVKYRHLIANKSKKSDDDRRKLADKQEKLQKIRNNSEMKRGVTVAISSRGFMRTGIMCDMVQHAMLIPVLICHLRFHRSLNILEERIGYKFRNRYYLQLALTHPSYRENFGTNPDHARNSLTNCGIRQPEYGDRKIHFQNTRKRGINTLISIMSKLGKQIATESNISHNERLEFLGDAVVEFVTSIHLFHTFPHIEEGGLATYRASIVENQNLAALGKKIGLEQFMLYAHGSDLCHELELKHAMANCFEALMGALFLDGNIQIADDVFSKIMFADEPQIYNQWMLLPKHPLQEQEPDDDRRWVKKSPILKLLQNFERLTGITFRHIRLLARVFTTRSLGYTNLTLGSNQRLEFLGDTVLQLITSAYLYNHFPEHHEGHLSLLRSSLVNNKTQSVVCNDIGMPSFAIEINPKLDLKMKDRADLLEALLGAMYIDKGMKACEQFCHVLFFPRLQYFILNQEWNDPKSKLQQCCLTLRTLNGGEPDIPIYKVIECKGPTNSRMYTVGVYFQNTRLASCTGSSIQQAEMNAAKKALKNSTNIFPQLEHQKRVIAKTIQQQSTREEI